MAAWLCQAGVELHLGHNGYDCPADAIDAEDSYFGSKGENTDDVDTDLGASDIIADDLEATHKASGGHEDAESISKEEAYKRNFNSEYPSWGGQDAEYGNGLPKLIGKNVVVIVDISGVHRLKVNYCRCPNA